MTVPGLAPLLSEEGWAYASLPPQEPGDPGRFHALFGRDSLITALQVLPAAPDVARATLRALAALQGTTHDPEIEEEPGKILHEYRPVAGPWFAEHGWPVRDGRLLYYGTADATSWFLVVLDRLGDAALAAELEPAWRAAGGWLAGALDRGGGYVRYGPRERGGLAQQGWRDSVAPVEHHPEGSGIVRADGGAPRAPLADADCQAAAVAALDALARLDPSGDWAARAAALRAAVAAWGPEGMALEADGSPVTGAGSQLGWLLWAGALDGGGGRRGGGPARPPRRADGVRAAHALVRASRVPRPRVPPGQHLAVRLLARLGRAARGRARGGRRARAARRAGRARPARPVARAVRRERGRRAGAGPARQPRAGLDGRRPLGARAGLGRRRRQGTILRHAVVANPCSSGVPDPVRLP